MFDDDGQNENTPINPLETSFDGESGFNEEAEEQTVCDCDPEYKDTHPIQQSVGMNLGGFGGHKGDGTTVIVCRNCGQRFYENEQDDKIGSW